MRRRAIRADILLRLALLGLLGLLLPGCSLFHSDQEAGPGTIAPPPPAPVLPYQVLFEGKAGQKLDSEIESALGNASQSKQQEDRPPASALLLERRGRDDVPRLVVALHSLGYYDGKVGFRIDNPQQPRLPPQSGTGKLLGGVESLAASPPTKLVFEAEPGPRYELAKTTIELTGETGGFKAPTAKALGLAKGDPAVAQRVLDGEQKLLDDARKAGHPLAELGKRQVIVDHATRTMDVTLRLTPGPVADYGEISFEGQTNIDTRFLRRTVPIRPDSRYNPEDVAKARQALVDTQLFTTVQVQTPKQLDATGRLPVTFKLVERKPRTIGASIGYQTDQGPNTSLFWEHRNLFGAGEKLHAALDLSAVEQSLNATFSKPAFLSRNQTLLANAALTNQDTDAFNSVTASAGVGLQRELIKKLIVSGGVAYTYADIDDHTGDRQIYGLVSLPLTLTWDYSDDLLDPTRGGRTDLATQPFADTLGSGVKFLQSTVTQTAYVPLLSSPRLILALRGSAGSIVGASRGEVPAIERFYAGGGGSIRGIPYQKAGPLNDKNDPLGGRSLLEASSELRLRVTPSVGVVAFLDSGNVYNSSVPDLSEPVEVGTGLGLRYVTPIGPLRFDIGVPVHPRKKVDDPYQVYIGIGQAF